MPGGGNCKTRRNRAKTGQISHFAKSKLQNAVANCKDFALCVRSIRIFERIARHDRRPSSGIVFALKRERQGGPAMRGIIYTELLDFMEAVQGAAFVEELIQEVQPASGGAYTRVGNYPHEEAVALVVAAAEKLNAAPEDLMTAYGQNLFQRFLSLYPQYFSGVHDAVSFLKSVDDHIHVEVMKLYTDSHPPRFEVLDAEDGYDLIYRSHRPMAPVAQGLIQGALDHFGDELDLECVPDASSDGTTARFKLVRRG